MLSECYEAGVQGNVDGGESTGPGPGANLPEPGHGRHVQRLHGAGNHTHTLLGKGHWVQSVRHQQPITGKKPVTTKNLIVTKFGFGVIVNKMDVVVFQASSPFGSRESLSSLTTQPEAQRPTNLGPRDELVPAIGTPSFSFL